MRKSGDMIRDQVRILYLLFLWSRRSVYTTLSRLKLAAANLGRGPNPGLKLVAAYFSRKEIVRLYRRSRLILAAAYVVARINGPIVILNSPNKTNVSTYTPHFTRMTIPTQTPNNLNKQKRGLHFLTYYTLYRK